MVQVLLLVSGWMLAKGKSLVLGIPRSPRLVRHKVTHKLPFEGKCAKQRSGKFLVFPFLLTRSDYAASFDNELFRFFSISVNKPGITLCAGFLKIGMIEEGGSARVC